MTRTDTIELSAQPLRLVLSPLIGGSISTFEWTVPGRAPTPLLRGCHTDSTNVLDAGCFPLVPFVNRIRGGEFSFRGREIRLAPNMAGDASPLHGQGWLAPWQVVSATDCDAELRFDHAPGEWPWAYRATQRFSLDEDGLTVTLSCRNDSDEPMPCGLGQHPYFPCGPTTRIATGVGHVWTIDEQVLPVARVPATGRFDLSDRTVCGLGLDHGFDGWSGAALLSDPAWPVELEMASRDARFFQLYSPEQGGLFVAEPVTHANAALNEPEDAWPKLGLRVLEPGESMQLEMRVAVRAT